MNGSGVAARAGSTPTTVATRARINAAIEVNRPIIVRPPSSSADEPPIGSNARIVVAAGRPRGARATRPGGASAPAVAVEPARSGTPPASRAAIRRPVSTPTTAMRSPAASKIRSVPAGPPRTAAPASSASVTRRPVARSMASTGQGSPGQAARTTTLPPVTPRPWPVPRKRSTAPVAGSSTRTRHASIAHDDTTSRPSAATTRSVANVGPSSGSGPSPSSMRTSDPPIVRRQIPRSVRVARSTRCSTIERPSGSRTALLITSGSSATAVAQPWAGSSRRSRETEPSSSPASTRPPAGPEANDSGARSRCSDGRPAMPVVSRCAASVPERSSTGSSRYQVPVPGGPPVSVTGHGGGSHAGPAPAPDTDWPGPRAPAAITAASGASLSHRRVSMSRYLLRRDRWLAGGGRGGHGDRDQLPAAYAGPGATLRQSTGPSGPCRTDAVWSRSRCDSGTVPLR